MSTAPSADPFPGLRPFEAGEEDLFFGREGQSEEILSLLRRHRFVAVVGASGSGKSSLVRAGLLPYLHGGFLAQAGSRWRVAMLRPGNDPFKNLATALNDPEALGISPRSADDAAKSAVLIEVSLRRGGLGLIEAIRLARLPDDEQVLIIVDQFEELFRFAGAISRPGRDEDAAAFIKLLLEASQQRELPIYVVLTMRSDYIGDCAHYRDLPEAVTAGLYLVPRMTREQRRAAIVEPVRVGGGSIAPRLVVRLLNDVGDDPDQLPTLQHALMRTWDHWKAHGDGERPIDLDDYSAIGGMADALSQHADEVYDALPDDRSRTIAKRIFQALSEKGPDNREARRPTTVEKLSAVVGEPIADIIRVADAFRAPGRSFLMPAQNEELSPASVIDISHESLIRCWRKMRQWVEMEADSARIYRRLAETASLHTQGAAALLRDPDLENFLKWYDKERPNGAWAERYHRGFEQAMAFLEQSRLARKSERRQSEKARRRIQFASSAATTVILIVALVAIWQWHQAEIESGRALQALAAADQQRDRARRALAATTQLANSLVFDTFEPLRHHGPLPQMVQMINQVIQDYGQVIKIDPKSAGAYAGRGVAYEDKYEIGHDIADLNQAIADFDQAIVLDPTLSRAFNDRGIAYQDKQDFDHAIADYERAIALDPNGARTYANLASAYNNKSDFDRAIANCDKAIALDPNFTVAYYNRGFAYDKKNDLDHATADYTQVITLDPNFVNAYDNRGTAYYRKGDLNRALADFARAITLDPKLANAYNNRGNVYHDKGDFDHAVADFEQAITLNPKFMLAYRNRGRVYRDKGDLDHAIADFDQAFALEPKNSYNAGLDADAHNDRCWTRMIGGKDLQQALSDCNESLRIRSDNEDAIESRGFVYLELGQLDDAIVDFNAALKIDSELAKSLYGRSLAKQKKGDRAGANADMAAAKAIQPDIAKQLKGVK